MKTTAPSNPNPPRGNTAARPQAAGSRPATLTAHQEKIRNRRERKLTRFNALVSEGWSRRGAAAETGCSIATIWRWERLVREHGLGGLLPKTPTGAPPAISPSVYTPRLVTKLQRLAVELNGSRAAAVAFAGDPRCPRELARYIRSRRCVPERLRALISYRRRKLLVRYAGRFTVVEGFPLKAA